MMWRREMTERLTGAAESLGPIGKIPGYALLFGV
jgi:hypothetical protein